MAVMHLIRHGRPALTGVILGVTDPPLASDVIVAACDLEVDVIFTSPLRRALDTARMMFPGRDLAVLPDLAERNMGEWDGLPWTEIERRWPREAKAASEDWFAFTAPGGERWESFVARVARVFDGIRVAHAAAVVAHAGVSSVLWELAGCGAAAQFQQEYGEVISIDLS